MTNSNGIATAHFSDDRERAMATDGLALLGLDHPLVAEQIAKWRTTAAEQLGASVRADGGDSAAVSWWAADATTPQGDRRAHLVALTITTSGSRITSLERLPERLLDRPACGSLLLQHARQNMLAEVIEPALQRELHHRGLLGGEGSF